MGFITLHQERISLSLVIGCIYVSFKTHDHDMGYNSCSSSSQDLSSKSYLRHWPPDRIGSWGKISESDVERPTSGSVYCGGIAIYGNRICHSSVGGFPSEDAEFYI